MTGREAYEEDCRRNPTYHDGTPRRLWDEISEIAQYSWNRDPRPRTFSTRPPSQEQP